MFHWINAAVALQEFCRKNRFPFAFIGGVALQRWGEPRVTRDVDITLFTGFGNEEVFIQALLNAFASRDKDAAEFALRRRVLLLKSAEGIGLDVSLGGLPYEESVVKRASYGEYLPGIELNTCSAEDLIVLKSFADRPQDWIDVGRVIVRQTNKLDWDYIFGHLPELAALKDSPEIIDRLKKLRIDCET
jgi:Nucleotidyl transferase AbiEii toxin, Type IV TA system